MTAPLWITLLVAVVTGAATLTGSLYAARRAARTESDRLLLERRKTNDLERRTEHARIISLEGRVDRLEDKRREDALLIRRQGDHIDTLERHIYLQLPPPPPPRPDGV